MAVGEHARILLALDVRSTLSATLAETLAGVAARLGAELEALFVEDAELMRAAELPFVSEVSTAGQERTFTPEDLRRLNRDASRDLERLLERAAQTRRIRWRYSTAQGSRLVTAFAAAEHCDLFLPGRPVRRRSAPERAEHGFRRVGIVVPGPVEAARALPVVRALAASGLTHEVILVCETRPPEELMASLARESLRTYIQNSPLAEPAGLLDAIRTHEPGLLIAPRSLVTASAASRALDTVPMSMLLLR